MTPAVAAVPSVECSTTGELGRTGEWRAQQRAVTFAAPISNEGSVIVAQVLRMTGVLERHHLMIATPASPAISFRDVERATWLGLAERLFPNSRPLSLAERRAFDATAWDDLETLDFEE